MARFYFSNERGEPLAEPTGVELPDIQTAKFEAIRFAGERLRDDPGLLVRGEHCRMVITNEGGVTMWTITIDFANGPGDPGYGQTDT